MKTYLVNTQTNKILEFSEPYHLLSATFANDPYRLATDSEIDAHELEKAQAEKIAQIKSTAASLILATYPTHKQLNILMSEDTALIEAMDIFITAIRTKSNELEAELDLLTDPEEIKNFPIKFS